ncbi:hypothetical protein [Archaeoglobus veneficus]|uniref:Cytochrome c assembly protein n=1 Tax=Archaeoglobus veneficus (strain DSM 11195 / SNP6) TaxID=693661 RepID=F2KS39_ARCVS|nr:hypothetical protein [Archaeoglobus veneficus]AEA47978.1 hypothetical protein Arcve_1985 [Archaeoglobus veneficus SNP6]
MRTVTLLLAAFMISAILAPPEERLGNSYKLIYLHLPLTFFSFLTIVLLPVLSLMEVFGRKIRSEKFAIAGVMFAFANLAVSALFMKLAWGGVAFSEPRFALSALLIILLILFIAAKHVSPYVAFVHSVLTPFLIMYAYSDSSTTFQLHPSSLVGLEPLMVIPMFFSFPLVALLYFWISTRR